MAPMYLTEEQRRALEAGEPRGQPVNVIDPQTQKTYVPLPWDQFERIRGLLGETVAAGGEEMSPAGTQSSHSCPRLEVPLPRRFRDLPTPPEVSEEVKRHCHRLGLRRRRYRQDVEDELKLQYYFGGRYVGYLPTDQGPVIVAAGKLGSEEFGRQLDGVASERRRDVILNVPSPWNDTISQILTPNL